jgi:hypothetical protein
MQAATRAPSSSEDLLSVVQTFPMGSHYHKQNWFSNKAVYLNRFGYSLAIISVLLI